MKKLPMTRIRIKIGIEIEKFLLELSSKLKKKLHHPIINYYYSIVHICLH